MTKQLSKRLLNPSRIGEKLYLACPYSSDRDAEMEHRFALANHAAGILINKGFFVISPISHSHPIACAFTNMSRAWEYWYAWNVWLISCCDILVILCIDGWKTSQGIKAERRFAKAISIPIYRLDPALIF